MVPEWAVILLFLLRIFIGYLTMLTALVTGTMKPEEVQEHPGRGFAALVAISLGMTYLILMPFEWPG